MTRIADNCAGLIQIYAKSGRAVKVNTSDEVVLSADDQGATTFMLVSCRSLSTVSLSLRAHCVSLMDVRGTDWYIRHRSSDLHVESESLTDDLPLFQLESSYIMHLDTFYTGLYALESVNFIDQFIKSDADGRLIIAHRSYTADYYDAASFRINSSGKYDHTMAAPGEGHGPAVNLCVPAVPRQESVTVPWCVRLFFCMLRCNTIEV